MLYKRSITILILKCSRTTPSMNKHLIQLARQTRNAVNNHCIDPLDTRGEPQVSAAYTPVFILGAPRCGSTLLSQLVTQCLEVGYFSNFHAQFYGSPALAERLRPNSMRSYQSDFSSKHGVTQGWDAPSENAAFWYRFFRRSPAYMQLNEMPEAKGRAFRRSITRFIKTCQSPIVLKNLYASLRLDIIRHYLPEAKFIVLHRNIVDNATSILNGRQKIYGDYMHWWSVEPPNIEDIKLLGPVQQVLAQIDSIYNLIKESQESTVRPTECFLHLQYDQLCAEPEATLARIADFIPNCKPRANSIRNLPGHFDVIKRQINDHSLQSELLQYTDARSLGPVKPAG